MKAKFTLPGRDMNIWTMLIALIACAAIVLGCIAFSVLMIALGVVYLVSVVRMWLGKSDGKWYLVFFFGIAMCWNLYVLFSAHITWGSLAFTAISMFLTVRFAVWKPRVAPASGRGESSAPTIVMKMRTKQEKPR